MGARTSSVVALFVRRKVPVIAAGIALGVAGAFGVGRLIRGMLVQTSPADPLTLTLLAGLLAMVTAVALVVPAVRASRIDPTTALRHD